MKSFYIVLVSLTLLGGCARGVTRGVQVRIVQGSSSWNACSLNVWHTYGDYGGESNVLHFIDNDKKSHEIAGQYRVDYSKIPCFD